jgi:hypothetical protein
MQRGLFVLSGSPQVYGLDEITIERAERLGEAEVRALLGRAYLVFGILRSRLVTLEARPARIERPDRFLTIAEAAARIRRSPVELYRHKRRYPFIVRDGGRVRVSEQRMEQWMKTGEEDVSSEPR